MKLFKGRQDTLSLLPGISIHWDRNYKAGGFYTFCVSFDWIFWFIGVDFIDWENEEIDAIRESANKYGLILELEEHVRSYMREGCTEVQAYRNAAQEWDL